MDSDVMFFSEQREVLAAPMSSLDIFMWLILTRVKFSLMISKIKENPS